MTIVLSFMRKALVFSIVGLGLTPAASHADPIGDQAEKCWDIGAVMTHGYDESDLRVVFDVEFGTSGEVLDINVVEYSPSDRDMVLSASRAVEGCGPYKGWKKGVSRVVLSLEPEPLIDPFKD